MPYDHTGCYRLLAAIVIQWLRDASVQPYERANLCAFLEITPAELHALLARNLPLRHRCR